MHLPKHSGCRPAACAFARIVWIRPECARTGTCALNTANTLFLKIACVSVITLNCAIFFLF